VASSGPAAFLRPRPRPPRLRRAPRALLFAFVLLVGALGLRRLELGCDQRVVLGAKVDFVVVIGRRECGLGLVIGL
jgi:hypothetical protein